jgi:hypothetical protein
MKCGARFSVPRRHSCRRWLDRERGVSDCGRLLTCAAQSRRPVFTGTCRAATVRESVGCRVLTAPRQTTQGSVRLRKMGTDRSVHWSGGRCRGGSEDWGQSGQSPFCAPTVYEWGR